MTATDRITYQDLCQRARVTDMIQALSDRVSGLYDEAARQKEYADLILRACNSHDELLKELRQARTDVKNLLAILDGYLADTDEALDSEDDAIVEQTRTDYDKESAAIAKAEGRA